MIQIQRPEMDALMKTLEEGDKVCVGEKGHAGDHTFGDDGEVEITYVGHVKEKP